MAKKGAAVDGDPASKVAAELKRMVTAILGEEKDEFALDVIDRAKEALFALRDLKASKTGSLRLDDVSLTCPEEFRCPLSKQLMRDPTVVVIGQVNSSSTSYPSIASSSTLQTAPLRRPPFAGVNRRLRPLTSTPAKQRMDVYLLTLKLIRTSLVRQEDSIILSLLERSQYCYNVDTYDPNTFPLDGFYGSLVEYMLKETEKLHAQVGRYKSPDEHPFFPDDLPEPVLPPLPEPVL